MKSLILLSGGMDSTTLLYERRTEIGLAVHFDYGSKHNHKEKDYARFNCQNLGIPFLSLDISSIFVHFKSALLKGGEEIPEGHYEEESMKKNIVPFRNGILLSLATGIAESNGFSKLLIANHFGDHAIFPDCRQSFIDPFTQSIREGTGNRIELQAPYTSITKKQIVDIGKQIPDLDYEKTWSCYVGGEYHCGKCGTCIERKEALGNFDPTIYL